MRDDAPRARLRQRVGLAVLLSAGPWLGYAAGAIAQLSLIEDVGGDRALGTTVARDVILGVDLVQGGSRPQNGQNLFHSFQQFNVQVDRSVYFANPAGVQNIFSRVTGNDPSDILGVLGVFGGNANLYLINPNGILFGPNASLDVGGSFVATTANAIEFGDRGIFSTTNPTNVSPLLTVNPSAFLFNAIDRRAGIINQSAAEGTTLLGNRPYAGLRVFNGQSLLLVGGDVQLQGGILQASGGRVELGGLAQNGRIGLSTVGGALQLQFPEGVDRSDVSLVRSPVFEFSAVTVAGGGGGNLSIHARNLTILNDSVLSAGLAPGSGTIGSQAGDIRLNVTGALQIDGGGVLNWVRGGAIGNSGQIIVEAGSLGVTNGARLSSTTFGQGDGGTVRISVREAATFEGVGSDGSLSGVGSQVGPEAVGQGGTLTLDVGSLRVTNGAQLGSSTFGQGAGGNVSITVRDTATFDGVGSDGSSSGVGSQVGPNAVGQGGTLTLDVGSLRVTNGAQLGSSTFGQGAAGNVSITVRDAATFDGVGSDGRSSAVGSQVGDSGVGQGGTLTLNAGSLSVTNGAQLDSSTFGQGDAGNVSITVREAATFDGVGSNGRSSSAGSEVGTSGVGQGGTLTLEAGFLSVTNGATLSSSTSGQGNAGNVSIRVRESARFDGVGSNGRSSGAGSQVRRNAVGQGGTLTLEAGSLSVTNGALLTSSTLGQGNAGNIVLRVRGVMRLVDGTIETAALQNAGGDIDIEAQSIRLVGDSDISTFVFSGAGGGGNITLSARSIVALNDSDILAFARDGRGGNVTLNTRAFFGQNYRPAPFGTDPATLEGNNRVDVNATGAVSGTISLPDTGFIQNNLNQIAINGIDTEKLLAQTCLIRKDGPQGTFYIVGTGGIPNRPSDRGLSDYATNTVQPTVQAHQRLWKLGDPIVEPQGFYKLADGRWVMSRECEPAQSGLAPPN
jgi:filamentous hemagglutinin family protein